MAGHRDDGTFAENTSKHPNRVVSLEAHRENKARQEWEARRAHPSYKGSQDDANPYGMVRPNTDEILDEWDPEDIAEKNYWDRANTNVNLGNHPDYENQKPSHMKYGWE